MPNSDQKFGLKQTIENDHRITRVGRVLRAAGMEELPQLITIFRGEMSFVGPRLQAAGEIMHDENGCRINYEEVPAFWKPLSVRPGLTSLSTVYRAKDVSPRKKFGHDLLYIRNQSFWLDVKLVALSFWISFRGKWETRGHKI